MLDYSPLCVMEKYDLMPTVTADGSMSSVIRFEVDKVSTLDWNGRFSPEVEVGGAPWRFNVCKGIDEDEKEYIFTYLNGMENKSTLWSIEVNCEEILINSDRSKDFVSSKTNIFDYEDDSRGGRLMEWQKLIDEEEGFIKDDKITLEIRFSIVNSRGLRITSRIDFTNPHDPCHDITLLIGGEKIYASKQILAVHSPVFKTMFYSEFVEKNKDEIELKDVDKKEFLEMLDVIYPPHGKVTDSNVQSLLALGDCFQINHIINLAEEHLITSDVPNLVNKLLLSDKYRLIKLQDYCFAELECVEDVKSIQKSPEFRSLSDATKAGLLERICQLAD